MSQERRLKVLLIAPYYDKNTPGESWCTYKWVEQISERCDVTVLTSHRAGWDAGRSPIKAVEVVNWTHPVLTGRLARLDWELKPHYLLFYFRVRRWLKNAIREGFPFDIVHQINPVAVRYPSPARNLGLPFVTGPHAGSLETPPGFLAESPENQWFRRLRSLDKWRLRHDPVLRSSFASAETVIGVAPYVQELLASIPVKRFALMAETGPELVIDDPKDYPDQSGPLRLLFVGRVIRTKGVIDGIRALALAAKNCDVTLDVVGTGDMADACVAEAEKLGVSHLVTFYGRIPRAEVYEWYRNSDVFLFPSFREPSGTVVFEAMGFGLPMITCTTGGPGYVITHECGIRVAPTDPQQFAADLAAAIVELATNRSRLAAMSRAALTRVEAVASWRERSRSLIGIYKEVARICPDPAGGLEDSIPRSIGSPAP